MATAAKQGLPVKEGGLPEPAFKDLEQLPFELQKKKDQEPVVAIFRWHEQPGGSVKFPYRRYKDEKVIQYTLTDGQKTHLANGIEVKTLPYGLVRHINDDCAYPEHSHIMDMNGNPIVSKRKGYQRMELIPTW